ncbi:peptidylprolyl isomerase [Umezawaea endophytica]|uniref:Peptidyl-prolyl cis-trans isomerase n=1 Tax=Umezawaea endophytica TaxID=1654476 RepID=A0A9X2VNE2_9PSEU|nr:peptidylprolyl isomerase [Umezawaea endophytica]MCS7479637.1 peptidylprolyl isomerase [Umezawaea endophytica]
MRVLPYALSLALVAGGCTSATPGRPVAGSATAPSSTVAEEPMPCRFELIQDGPLRRIGTPPDKGFRTSGKSTIRFDTSLGRVDVELDAASAPCSVHNFRHLVRQQVYKSGTCHRLTLEGIFVLQCGDPTDTGFGTVGYQFADPTAVTAGYARGVVAMANSGPGTNSSQFFIVHEDSPAIVPDSPVIGRVVRGMDVIDQVVAGGVLPDTGLEPSDGKPAKLIVFLIVEPA